MLNNSKINFDELEGLSRIAIKDVFGFIRQANQKNIAGYVVLPILRTVINLWGKYKKEPWIDTEEQGQIASKVVYDFLIKCAEKNIHSDVAFLLLTNSIDATEQDQIEHWFNLKNIASKQVVATPSKH
jgi:hypothetical protein